MGWRKDTRAIIRAYPELKRRARELHDVSLTANYGTQAKVKGVDMNVILPGSGEASRTTEDVALRQLSPGDQRALDAVSAAIQTTLSRHPDGKRRLQLIDLMYWRNSHYMQGAADLLYISYSTARRWNDSFVELVDAYLQVF